MTMIVGITATRLGMTELALARIRSLVFNLKPQQAHHGGCAGGDRQFHDFIASDFAFPRCRIVLHPPAQEDDLYQFKWYEGTPGMIVLPGLPHLKRNTNIVRSVGIMFGVPHTRVEQPRGGTWFTIREARRANKPLVLVYPDGSYEKENVEKWPHRNLLP